MTQKSQLLHDSSLVIRLPKALHTQLEQVATAQYMKMGELVRNLIKEEIKRANPYLNTTSLQQSTQARPQPSKPSNRPMPPRERDPWDTPELRAEQEKYTTKSDDYGDDWA